MTLVKITKTVAIIQVLCILYFKHFDLQNHFYLILIISLIITCNKGLAVHVFAFAKYL